MVRLFVLGAPCAGKSAVAVALRRCGVRVIDTDEEIERLNGGVWPSDIDTKNTVLLPQVLDMASELSEVVLLNSYMPLEYTQRLRNRNFAVALLDVAESELRRRDRCRFAEEGWSNIEWFDWHQSVISDHRDQGLIDHVVDGERPLDAVVDELIGLLRNRPA